MLCTLETIVGFMKTDFFLAKTEFYAPFPIFKLNGDLTIGDANLATHILLSSVPHEDFEGSIREISKRPSERNDNYPVGNQLTLDTATEGDAIIDMAEAHLDSKEFGAIALKLTIFTLPDPCSVNLLDRTVYAEIAKIEHEDIYRRKLQAALQHQLIWETYAISYDLVLQELDFYCEVVNRHGRAMSARGINRVIDIGAGTGNVAIPLVRTGRSVTAVDISRAMLDRLRSKLGGSDNAKISILQQDAKDLSALADGSFDGVNIMLALFDMSDPFGALKEAIRVLRPGGSLIITEPKRTFNLPALLCSAETCLRNKGVYEKLLSHWTRVTKVNKKIDPSKRPTPLFIEDIQYRLEKSDFNITQMEDSHYGNCATLLAIKTG
jgi:ubiquinone/menaquinone biosynthesis C-methylase UbiE